MRSAGIATAYTEDDGEQARHREREQKTAIPPGRQKRKL